jgi:hypothetical protein
MVGSEHYTTDILESFFQSLTEEEKQHVNFCQDNAVAHTSQHSQSFWQKKN